MYLEKRIENLVDEGLMHVLKEHGGYIAGGCLTSLSTNKPVNDYDVYFKDSNALFEAVSVMKEGSYHLAFVSDKSLSFVNSTGDKYQFIYYNYYESSEEIFKEFDFTINMAAYDFSEGKVVTHETFMLHNSQRYLSFNSGTLFPLLSALRVQKYKDRGYYISKAEYVKILLACMKVELCSWKDFQDHMGGLYGFNLVTNEALSELETQEFSIDNALSVLDNLEFNEGNDKEFDAQRFPYEVVEYVISGKPLDVHKNSFGYESVDGLISNNVLTKLINDGVLKYKVASRKDVIGKYLYKWVTNDLRSYYRKDFQYKLGEKIEAWDGRRGLSVYDGTLYMHKYDQVERSMFKQDKILICEYDESDIKSLTRDKVLVTSVTPIAVVQTFQQLKAFVGEEEE